jgi:RNA polymerase sigma-70 factor (ECF subfamily)
MTKLPYTLPSDFEKLFRDFFTPLVWYSMKYVKDKDTAHEIVHSVFVALWEKADTIDFTRAIKPYLYKSVYNRSINYLRDNRKFTTQENIDPEIFLQINDSLETQEAEQQIYAAIAALPEKTREIFELSRFESKKYHEIAESMGISVKTVEARMSEALRILRVKLSDYIKIFIIMLIEFFHKN